MPVRPAISRMLRRAASSNSSSVATGAVVVKAWQVVVPDGEQIVEEASRAVAGIGAVLVLDLLREDPLLQPRQKMLAERADHPGLREVDMAVDEARQDQPVADRRDRQARVPRRDLVVRAEVGDPAVLDDQQPIGEEARGVLLPCRHASRDRR